MRTSLAELFGLALLLGALRCTPAGEAPAAMVSDVPEDAAPDTADAGAVAAEDDADGGLDAIDADDAGAAVDADDEVAAAPDAVELAPAITCTTDSDCGIKSCPGPLCGVNMCNACIVGHCTARPAGTSCGTNSELSSSCIVPTCDGKGQCYPKVTSCDDGNDCTYDSCNVVSDQIVCQHQESLNTPWPCDDGDPCTVDGHCNAFVCSSIPLQCDDGEPCTADACVGGCIHTPLAGACESSGGCGTCEAGSCSAAQAPVGPGLQWTSTTIEYVNDLQATSDGGAVLVGEIGMDGVGFRVDKDGKLLWQKVWPKAQTTAVAVAKDGTLLLGTEDGVVWTAAADGSLLTKVKLSKAYRVEVLHLLPDGGLLVATEYGHAARLSAAGAILWEVEPNFTTVAAVIDQGAGWLVFGSVDAASASGWTPDLGLQATRLAWLGSDGAILATATGGWSPVKYGNFGDTWSGFNLGTTGLAVTASGDAVLSAVHESTPDSGASGISFDGLRIDPIQGKKFTTPIDVGLGTVVGYNCGLALADGRFVAGGQHLGNAWLAWLTAQGKVLGTETVPWPEAKASQVVRLAERGDGQLWVAMTGAVMTRLIHTTLAPLACN